MSSDKKKKKWGRDLKIALIKIGATMADLSRITGIPYNTFKDYSCGKYAPSTERQQQIESGLLKLKTMQ